MIKLWVFCMTAVFSIVYALSPAGNQQPLIQYTFREVHMGTEFKIVLYAPNKKIASKAVKAAFARIAALDRIMSDYKKDSELMQLCKKAGGRPVAVSKDLFGVLSRAQVLAKKTNGAFDVTIGPVVRLWRRARRTRQFPEIEELRRALAAVGHKNVVLDARRRTIHLLVDGMRLDLGGIAKGFAADAALAVLRRFGITRAFVAASGDIAVGAAPPKQRGWKIGIGNLKDPTATTKQYLLLRNAAVSTSGDVYQFVKIKGKRYSHIVDPRTGVGLVGRISVTVVARDATTSDSMATAVTVLGVKNGMKLVESTKDCACLIMRLNDKGRVETFRSKELERFALPGK